MARDPTYRPLADYGLIGNGRTAALVARDGSIDWCCWPAFDSPAVFCRLLDAVKGGWFWVGPVDLTEVTRCYAGATNVLTTTFRTATGQVRLIDFMPGPDPAGSSPHRLLRLIEGLAGRLPVQVEFAPTFDYARAGTSIERCPDGAVARSGRESLRLHCSVPLQPDACGLVGRTEVSTGDRWWITLTYGADADPMISTGEVIDAEAALDRTLRYWVKGELLGNFPQGFTHLALIRSALTIMQADAKISERSAEGQPWPVTAFLHCNVVLLPPSLRVEDPGGRHQACDTDPDVDRMEGGQRWFMADLMTVGAVDLHKRNKEHNDEAHSHDTALCFSWLGD